jgi:hypothetical protein
MKNSLKSFSFFVLNPQSHYLILKIKNLNEVLSMFSHLLSLDSYQKLKKATNWKNVLSILFPNYHHKMIYSITTICTPHQETPYLSDWSEIRMTPERLVLNYPGITYIITVLFRIYFYYFVPLLDIIHYNIDLAQRQGINNFWDIFTLNPAILNKDYALWEMSELGITSLYKNSEISDIHYLLIGFEEKNYNFSRIYG